jgi:hypothetical protein
MPINVYDLGDKIRLRANFNDTVQDVDPAQVTFAVKTPLGTVQTYQYNVGTDVVRDAMGNYYVDYTPTVEGTYYYRAAGMVSHQGAAENYFIIRQSYFN